MDELKRLPIYSQLDSIADALLSSPSRFLVLTAETGAGKSTAVPVALLSRVRGSIVMLEPRRIATIAIADRIAHLLGEECGQTAGYRIRLESRIGSTTRIEVITEAILTRRIQSDPSLSGISVVILDEFHERSIHTDLALALLKEIMSLRDDLYVIVMSATIDASRVSVFLGCPSLNVTGRMYPVSVGYAVQGSVQGTTQVTSRGELPVFEKAARAVRDCLSAPGGNILVFLPGKYEISRTAELLSDCGAEVLSLHGSIPLADQRYILSPSESRRVILSTSIAETSLTVPGVTIVIDSGLSRLVRFDIRTGMDHLVTESESEFQAEQRTGRAGRVASGTCVRLWSRQDHRVRETPGEITRSDIVPLVLECALWGALESTSLDWLDPPNEASWKAAQELLREMGALDVGNHVTERGRTLAALGVHPRIGAVALEGESALAAHYASSGRDIAEERRVRDDLERRLDRAHISRAGVSKGEMALLAGFPDRLARLAEMTDGTRNPGLYQFPSGRLASLPRDVRAAHATFTEWIVCPEADSGEREGKIYTFEPLETKAVEQWLESRAETITRVAFANGKYAPGTKVIKTETVCYGKIILKVRRVEPEPSDVARAVVEGIRKEGITALPWSKASTEFLARARYRDPSITEKALLAALDEWLVPFLDSAGKVDEKGLLDALGWYLDKPSVERDVPTRITLANGISRPLAYEEITPGQGLQPVLETRVQDLFGCPGTPLVCGKPVLLRLLSPARRPVQITGDLASFWKSSWLEVRKELKGRYPKHDWPENPALSKKD
jgi:ATP-dependent helicase HrpB